MSDDGDEDRVNRLRQRRQKTREAGEKSETGEQSEASDTSEPSKTSETSETAEESEREETSEQSLKDELVGTYMYLPEGLKEDVDRYYKKLSGDYEFEYGDELEKNRHYYQLVVRHGFEAVREADTEEVREMVEAL